MRARWLIIAVLVTALAMVVGACGDDDDGGGGTEPIKGTKLTVYSSLPLQGAAGDQGKAIQSGAALAVEQRKGRVGKYTITYKQLDDALASVGAADEGKARQNARQAVSDETAVGYLGEYNSGISKVTIPINNRAGLAHISPANTYVGLTTNEPGSEPGEPDKYYPTGKRTYARIVPKDTIQAKALAIATKKAGCKSIRIWNSKTTYSAGLARNLEMAAEEAGLEVEGNDGIDPKQPNYRSLAANIKADCFVWTGEIESNGSQALKDAAATSSSLKLFAGDGNCLNAAADPTKGVPKEIAGRFQCTIATLDPEEFGPEGKKFFADYKKRFKTDRPDTYAIYGFEAMSLMLDSIERASQKGELTREAVVNEVLGTKNRKSVLGTYSIDANGDTSLTDYGLYTVEEAQLLFKEVLKTGGS